MIIPLPFQKFVLPDNKCPDNLRHPMFRQVLLRHLHCEVRYLDVHLRHLHLLCGGSLYMYNNCCPNNRSSCNNSCSSNNSSSNFLYQFRSSLCRHHGHLLYFRTNLSNIYWRCNLLSTLSRLDSQRQLELGNKIHFPKLKLYFM